MLREHITQPLSFPEFDRHNDDFYDLVSRDVSLDDCVDEESDYLRTANEAQNQEWLAVLNMILDDLAIQHTERKRLWESAKDHYESGSDALDNARNSYTSWHSSAAGFENVVRSRAREVNERMHNLRSGVPADFDFTEFTRELTRESKELRKFVIDRANEGDEKAQKILRSVYGAEKSQELCEQRLANQKGL